MYIKNYFCPECGSGKFWNLHVRVTNDGEPMEELRLNCARCDKVLSVSRLVDKLSGPIQMAEEIK